MQLTISLPIALLIASRAIASPHIRPRVAVNITRLEPISIPAISIVDPETPIPTLQASTTEPEPISISVVSIAPSNPTTQGGNTPPEPILTFPTGAIDPEISLPTLQTGASPIDTSSVF